jgi:hypothetical protein
MGTAGFPPALMRRWRRPKVSLPVSKEQFLEIWYLVL